MRRRVRVDRIGDSILAVENEGMVWSFLEMMAVLGTQAATIETVRTIKTTETVRTDSAR